MSPFKPCPVYNGYSYDPDVSVGHQLVSLLTVMRRTVELRMAEHGLTDAQWKPLWMLKAGRGDTAIELARNLDMDAGAATRLVDRLVAKGLVERLRSESDRRVVHLKLTPAGEAVADQVPHVLAAMNNQLLTGFSEAEWAQLLKLIERMATNLQAVPGERGNP